MGTTALFGDIDGIASAASILRAGGLVAIPTETVYGLAADAENAAAVAGIYAAKGRPAGQPLIVHVLPQNAERYALAWSERAAGLAEVFWPGPLTIVVPKSVHALPEVTGGLDSVGLRSPAHPVAASLLREFGTGLAAPSANLYGHVSPTTAEHVLADLGGRIDAILDAGPCRVGLESTIVELRPGQPATLLRRGGVGVDAIAATLGEEVRDGVGGAVRAPGMVESHYAPAAPVEVVSQAELAARIDAGLPDDVLVIAPLPVDHERSIALGGDRSYAAGLYAAMRRGDDPAVRVVLVVPPTDGPFGPAILDRLTRAAHPR